MYFRICRIAVLLAAVAILPGGCDNKPAAGGNGSASPAPAAPTQGHQAGPKDLISKVTASPPVAAPPSTPKVGPAFFAEKSTFDIGTVWMGKSVPVLFTFKNVGTEPLKILEIKPGCGCTSAQDYTREVPPGGEGRVPLTLNTTNKPNGVMHPLTVDLKTNDPAKPTAQFLITGTIKTVCVFDPPLGGVMAEVQSDQSINRTVKMFNNTGSPLTLNLQPIPPNSFFKVDFREVIPNQQWEFTASREAPIPEGNNYTQLTFMTNVPEVPVYNVPISCMVNPRIQVLPPSLWVSQVKDEATPRDIRIINNGKTPVNVLSVECSRPDFNVSLTPPGPAPAGMHAIFAAKSYVTHTINLTLPPKYQPPPWGELIQVKTDDALMPVIDIYVVPTYLNPGSKPPVRPPDQPLVMTPIKMPGK